MATKDRVKDFTRICAGALHPFDGRLISLGLSTSLAITMQVSACFLASLRKNCVTSDVAGNCNELILEGAGLLPP